MTYLFHIDQYMPEAYKKPIFEGKLQYRSHAIRESMRDRYGEIQLPDTFSAANARLIEVEYDERSDLVVKQLWRQKLDDKRDLLLAITRDGFVKTVWVNLATDTHRTLDKARYVRR